jgi:Ca2+-binding RTX toxin-like protein
VEPQRPTFGTRRAYCKEHPLTSMGVRELKKTSAAVSVAVAVMAAALSPSAAAGGESCGGRPATIVGSHRSETIEGTRFADVIAALGGNDVIRSLAGNDLVCGGEGNDKVIAANGHDMVRGQGGNDTMQGGRGDDRLDGGGDADTASYKDSDTPVSANLDIRAAIGEGADALVAVERLIGSDHADTLTGDAGRNSITGLGGADRIEALGGIDIQKGGVGDDRISGGDGVDSHYGGPGDDFMDGGDGSDTPSFKFSPGPVTVDMAEGTATGEGDDTFVNMEIVAGSRHADTLLGDDESNTFYPLGGDDQVDGRGGFDFVLYVQSAGPVVVDLLEGSSSGEGADTLTSIGGAVGSAYDDELRGDDSDNALYGVGGDDTLDGRGGDDVLSGGPDTDSCTNGETLDTCE